MLQIKKLAPKWYTPRMELEDKDGVPLDPLPEDPVQFQLQPLKHAPMAKVAEHAYLNAVGVGLVRPQGLVAACQHGVIGWRNVLDEQGLPLEFSRKALEDVPFDLMLELGSEVVAHNTLSDAEVKN